jgi:hypothetical protein
MFGARRLAAFAAAGALVITPLAGVSGTAHAAPMKPEGFALVSVDGGTATTKEIGKHRYRITTPMQSQVHWIGRVKGKGDQSGTFTRQELITRWTKLGYRPDKGAPATLSWWDGASGMMQTKSALITNPKVNADGKLVFTAKVVDRDGNRLPSTMPNFVISMQRPDSVDVRGYPIYWPLETLSSTFGWIVSTGADTSGSAQFLRKDSSGSWVPCTTTDEKGEIVDVPPASASGTAPGSPPFKGFTCGETTVLTNVLHTYIAYPWTNQSVSITVCTMASVTLGATPVSRCGTKYSWAIPGGKNPSTTPSPTS